MKRIIYVLISQILFCKVTQTKPPASRPPSTKIHHINSSSAHRTISCRKCTFQTLFLSAKPNYQKKCWNPKAKEAQTRYPPERFPFQLKPFGENR